MNKLALIALGAVLCAAVVYGLLGRESGSLIQPNHGRNAKAAAVGQN